MFRVLLF